MKMTERGKFVVFEGGDGCGKSTQSRRLAQRSGALLTYQPGGTAIGTALRSLLLDPQHRDLDLRAEALLMAADRAQHVGTLIEPTLASGRSVVCDRYIGSSLAYQGYGRGLDLDQVRALSEFASGGLWPDLVVLLVVPREVASDRMGPERDRFESLDDGFRERVEAGYRAQADADPQGWCVVDGVGTEDEVTERIVAVVQERLGVSW